jgi:DNA invertase Pin-like site-specific DNA recombinase
MKAIGYMRLSLKDQSRYSLDAQEDAIRNYCTKNSLELVGLFKDNGQRSYTFDRVDFRALELFVKKHKGLVRYMIVMEHDRFSRDISEALSKINKLENNYGLKVLSVDEPLDLNTADPAVFLIRAFKYLTANAELLHIRARTKTGLRGARLEGRFINNAPFGLKNDRDFLGKSILTTIAEEKSIVHQIFHYYLSGLSISQVTDKARQMGFPKKGHNAIGRILGNCLYAGLIRVVNEDRSVTFVKALHEAIVSEADFWLVQEMMGKNKPSKIKSNNDFPLKGLLRCHCGKYMTAGWSKGKKKYYLYYRCARHAGVNIPGPAIHEQLGKILEHLKLTFGQAALMEKMVGAKLEAELENMEQQITARQRIVIELDKKMEGLEEHLIKGNLDVATFKKWSERCTAERKQLEDKIKILEQDISNQRQGLLQYVDRLDSIDRIYQQCTSLQKQMLLKRIFRYGFTYANGILRTYSVCSSLSHNNEMLLRKRLLNIDNNKAISDEAEERFLNFISDLLFNILTESHQEYLIEIVPRADTIY